jgi:hypothetical protein
VQLTRIREDSFRISMIDIYLLGQPRREFVPVCEDLKTGLYIAEHRSLVMFRGVRAGKFVCMKYSQALHCTGTYIHEICFSQLKFDAKP